MRCKCCNSMLSSPEMFRRDKDSGDEVMEDFCHTCRRLSTMYDYTVDHEYIGGLSLWEIEGISIT